MTSRTTYHAATIAAIGAFIGAVVILLAGLALPPEVTGQPSRVPLPPADFLRASNEYAQTTLNFFAGDTLFVVGYLLVFAGLYAALAERARLFALVGLVAGVIAGGFDALENGLFVWLALRGQSNPVMPDDAGLPGLMLALYLLTHLKWAAAFLTLASFGLIFPRRNRLEWAIALLMWGFVVVGLLGVALPALIVPRGLFLLVGMPLFAAFFWQEAGKVASS
jgi:hypothetical protein